MAQGGAHQLVAQSVEIMDADEFAELVLRRAHTLCAKAPSRVGPRAELAAEVEAWLAAGHAITAVPPGATAMELEPLEGIRDRKVQPWRG